MVNVPLRQVIGKRLARSRPLDQRPELGANGAQALLVGVADDRHQQSPLRIDRHAQVDKGQALDPPAHPG